MLKKISTINVGPFDAIEAETITELALDSKELYRLLESFLRGDLTLPQFLNYFENLVDALHSNYVETEIQIQRDAAFEVCHG